jgi:putative spermidine/putrescine transport system permease protein
MDSKVTLEPAVPSPAAGQLPSLAQALIRWGADWLPALPLLLVTYGLLVAPVVALLIQSFWADEGGLSLSHWAEVLTSRGDRRAIITSLQLGFTSATIALVLGGPAAWLISRMLPVRRSIWLALLNMATNFSSIGLAFGFVSILGTYGMVTLAFQQLGLPFVPPPPGSFWGLVLAYSYTNVPLFILLTIAGMGILRHDWLEAAQTCGATQWRFWRSIGLPILTPFLGAGWLLVFTWSLGLYGIPFALAGNGATRKVTLITLEIGDILQASISGQGEAAVLAMVLLVLAGGSLFTYRWMLRRAAQWF